MPSELGVVGAFGPVTFDGGHPSRANISEGWRRGWDSHYCRVLKTKNLREFRFRTIRQIRTKAL
jgi:hypothetical protein